MGKENLSPQAAEYYKRLLLVSDRYYLLMKTRNRLRLIVWLLLTVAILQAVYIIEKIT